MPQARKAHFDSTTNNKTPPMEEKRTHGLSFKRANFSLDRIPLPKVNNISKQNNDDISGAHFRLNIMRAPDMSSLFHLETLHYFPKIL